MSIKQTLLQPFRDLQTMWNDSVRDYREALDGDFAPMVKATAITFLAAIIFTLLGMFVWPADSYIIFFVFCGFIFLAWCGFALHKVWQRFFVKAKIGYDFARNNINYGGFVYYRLKMKVMYFKAEHLFVTRNLNLSPRKKGQKWDTWFAKLNPKQQFYVARLNFYQCQAQLEFLSEFNPNTLSDKDYKLYKYDVDHFTKRSKEYVQQMEKAREKIN